MSHSNIIMYVESFIDGPNLYIVMDFADGGDLSSGVQRRKASGALFEEHEAMNFFVQVGTHSSGEHA
jgi:NIMA (never in mitosis gene a)-related kinase